MFNSDYDQNTYWERQECIEVIQKQIIIG